MRCDLLFYKNLTLQNDLQFHEVLPALVISHTNTTQRNFIQRTVRNFEFLGIINKSVQGR